MKRARLFPLLALVLASSCASEELFRANREALERSLTAFDSGDYRVAADQSEGLVARTSGEARKYQLQRFFATYVVAQVHAQAAFSGSGAFLQEPAASRGMTLGSAGTNGGFSIPHAIAAARTIGFAYDWSPASEAAPEALEENLPPSLAALGVTNAKLGMDLCRLAILSHLGFTAKTNSIVASAPTMQDLEGCQELMDRTSLLPALRPWITYAVFQYLKDDRELQAYKFAVRTLFVADGGESGHHGVGRQLEEELREWITTGSSYEFTCNTCGTPANPTEEICPNINCPTPRNLIEFVGEERE